MGFLFFFLYDQWPRLLIIMLAYTAFGPGLCRRPREEVGAFHQVVHLSMLSFIASSRFHAMTMHSGIHIHHPSWEGTSLKHFDPVTASSVVYNIHTLYLFIRNDIKVIVLPSLLFALSYSTTFNIDYRSFVTQTPAIISWLVIQLLLFAVGNQRRLESQIEDRENKPWRPLPSGRITTPGADTLYIAVIPLALLSGWILGAARTESVLLPFFSWLYNDRRMGDTHWVSRNLLNACGFVTFASGAASLATKQAVPLAEVPRLLLIAAIVATTIHAQDLYDQTGDAKVGRCTLPLRLGDWVARVSFALGLGLWTFVVCCVLPGAVAAKALFAVTGLVALIRTLVARSEVSDKTTFRIYTAGWLVAIYVLPMTA